MAFFLYILRCADDTYYIGSTNDLQKRLREHNYQKKGARYTKMRRPVVLMYSEELKTLSAVRKRELEVKKWPRYKKEKLWEK